MKSSDTLVICVSALLCCTVFGGLPAALLNLTLYFCPFEPFTNTAINKVDRMSWMRSKKMAITYNPTVSYRQTFTTHMFQGDFKLCTLMTIGGHSLRKAR